MRRAALLGAGAVVALAAVAVASAEDVPVEKTPEADARPGCGPGCGSGRDQGEVDRPMPDLLGKGLWRVFTALAPRTRLDVHDVAGRDRRVLWPPNWRVCTQYPAGGAALDGRTAVVIGVVKRGESCPPRVTSARR